MFRIVLIHPQIPPNTGQIARLCAATGTTLHLVRPLGFRLTDRSLRRAGLDYWGHVETEVHESLEAFLRAPPPDRCWLFTKAGRLRYDQVVYRPGDWLIFGSETDGLPPELTEADPDRTVRIPIRRDRVRSLNLASAASIALYEALRQTEFELE
jgi:tRNA (cytidine/uridine-2'-O-)-methyltransferase